MAMLPKTHRHVKGQADHVDAWLMSYADLITLLFMFFVIFVSVTYTTPQASFLTTHGEPEHPYIEEKVGSLTLETPFEGTYSSLSGMIVSNGADQNVSVEKLQNGLKLDLSTALFFQPGTADLHPVQVMLLSNIIGTLKQASDHSMIEIEGYTDDQTVAGSPYANNWELSAMRAAKIASLFIDQGVEPRRMRATSYADNNPIVPNSDVAGNPILENRLRNQRVIIRVLSQTSAGKNIATLQ